MRGRERCGDLTADARGPPVIEGPSTRGALQSLAAQELHREPGEAVLRLAGVDHGDDVRMIETAEDFDLPLEAFDDPLLRRADRDDLERDVTVDDQVSRPINAREATAA